MLALAYKTIVIKMKRYRYRNRGLALNLWTKGKDAQRTWCKLAICTRFAGRRLLFDATWLTARESNEDDRSSEPFVDAQFATGDVAI